MIYLNLVAALQSFLFAFLLYKNINNNTLNKLLGVVLLVLGFTVTGNFLLLSDILSGSLYSLFFFSQVASVFVAPVIFYYLNLLSGKKPKLNLLYFCSIFVLAYLIVISIEFIGFPISLQKEYMSSMLSEKYPKDFKIFTWLYVVLQHVYFSIAWVRIYMYKKLIGEVFSTRSRTRNYFAYKFISFIWVLDFLLLISLFVLPMNEVQFLILPSKIIIAFSFIVNLVFQQNVIFDEDNYVSYLQDVELLQKASESNTDENASVELSAKEIREILVEQKIFLNPAVTIFELSTLLGYPHRVVSQVINKEFHQTFSNLINNYRVEEAKVRLKNNPKNLTMEGVGLESGFNSRASFYRVFKQKTKQTPSEYMKQHCK
jgi:AraC-like DNA-binding protein